MKRIATVIALPLCFAAGLAFACPDKKAEDPKAQVMRGLNDGNKALVLSGLKELGSEGGEEKAKFILGVALKFDGLKKFKPAASNEIYEAAEEALAEVTDAKGEAFIFKEVKNDHDPRVKVMLCDVIARKKSAGAEDALVDALKDRNPTVVKTAIQHLGVKKSKKAFDPVIEILGKVEKKHDEPWLDCLRFLTSLTSMDLSTAGQWKDWWGVNKDKWDPSKVNPRPQGMGVGQTISRDAPKLFGTEVLSKRVVFILDVSGSMTIKDPKAEPMQPKPPSVSPKEPGYVDVPMERMRMFRLKEAMTKVIESLPADTKFSMLTFATNVRPFSKDLMEANAKNKQDAIDFANSMQAEGYTVTDEALRTAFDMGGEANTFYLFSDGWPQRGKNPDGTPQYIDCAEILSEVQQTNRTRKVKIFTIGIGEANPDFMRALAQQNGGTFVAVD